MKRILSLSILLLVAVMPSYAIGLAKMCSTIEGMTTITITKQMMGVLSTMRDPHIILTPLASKLNQVEIISAADEEQHDQLMICVKKYIKDNAGFVEILSVKDDNEKINLYMLTSESGQNEYLIMIDEWDEMTVVLLQGTLTPDDVSRYTEFNL